MNNTLSLTRAAGKLIGGKWMIKVSEHKAMMDILESYLSSPNIPELPINDITLMAKPDNGMADGGITQSNNDLVGIIHVGGILSKGPSELEQALLGMTDVDTISAALDEAANDPEVSCILLNFASVGGETTGIEELGRKIEEIDENIKPVYAYTSDVAASAAYWLMSQARVLGMSPSAEVGSIGVYSLLISEKKALDDAGIEVQAFSAGKYKLLGQTFKPLDDEEKKIVQEGVDNQHEQFKQTVKSKRPISDERMGVALTYNGKNALANGFVDVVTDSMDDFIEQTMDETNMKTLVEKKSKPAPQVPTPTEPSPKKAEMAEVIIMKSEAVPGVPGTTEEEDEHAPTPKMEEHKVDDDKENEEEEVCLCDACHQVFTKMKKLEEKKEPNNNNPDNDLGDDNQDEAGTKGYVEVAKVEVKAEEVGVSHLDFSGAGWREAIGIPKSKAMSPEIDAWRKAQSEIGAGIIMKSTPFNK